MSLDQNIYSIGPRPILNSQIRVSFNPFADLAQRVAASAQLTDDPAVEEWIEAAEKLAEKSSKGAEQYNILWGLVAAFEKYGITYNWGGSPLAGVKSPGDILRTKQARCFDSASFATASLRKLTDGDYTVVIIASPTHYMAGIILDVPQLEGLKSIKLSADKFLFPFEFDFDPTDKKLYSVEDANQRAIEQTTRLLTYPTTLILEAGTRKILLDTANKTF